VVEKKGVVRVLILSRAKDGAKKNKGC